MAKVKVAAYVAGTTNSSGVTIAVSQMKNGQFIRIGMSLAAQEAFFGGGLNPDKDAIEVMLDDEPGMVHVIGLKLSEVGDADALPITGGIKGSISIKAMPWTKIAQGKRPATSMAVINQQKQKLVSLKLPEWARLAPRKIGQGKPLMD